MTVSRPFLFHHRRMTMTLVVALGAVSLVVPVVAIVARAASDPTASSPAPTVRDRFCGIWQVAPATPGRPVEAKVTERARTAIEARLALADLQEAKDDPASWSGDASSPFPSVSAFPHGRIVASTDTAFPDRIRAVVRAPGRLAIVDRVTAMTIVSGEHLAQIYIGHEPDGREIRQLELDREGLELLRSWVATHAGSVADVVVDGDVLETVDLGSLGPEGWIPVHAAPGPLDLAGLSLAVLYPLPAKLTEVSFGACEP